MSRRYFGTDGVRGKVGQCPITPDFALKLGQAAGRVFKRHSFNGHATVLIGKDTRVSGYMLEAALQAGFSSAGVDVLLCGPLPTPGVAYLTRALRLDAGVVISASHNPYDDNGIKFFSAQGSKFSDDLELEIEAEIERGFECVCAKELGKARRIDDASGRYIEFCKSTVDSSVNLKGLKILVDCAHGAAYHVAPDVLHELGAEVVTVGCSPNGLNINDGVGATHTEHLSALTRQYGCDLAISLDGDADRLMMADPNGHVYNGDELLYILVKDRLEQGQKVAGVVGTLMTNYGLESRLKALGIELVRAKVGDRYVLEQLVEHQWILGGETSGHLLALDKQTTGDGIVSALQILSAIRRQSTTLYDLTKDLNLYEQVLVNIEIPKSFDWATNDKFSQVCERVNRDLIGIGRLLVRPSGTEPLLRIMVEAADPELAKNLAMQCAQVLKSEIGE